MIRAAALLLLLPVLAAAASAPVQPRVETVDEALKRARAEASAADARVRTLEQAAGRARDDASRLRARQAAAAEAISAAEARISAADAQARIIAARLSIQRARLREQQRPTASLLAGLAMMARRPPLLALADGASTDEFVRVRLLLDASLPVIRRRSAILSARLARGQNLERGVIAARQASAQSRAALVERRAAFARLEQQALLSAEDSGHAAINAGDVAIASNEELEELAGDAESVRSGAQLARELAALGPAPFGPAPNKRRPSPPIAYRLPVAAPLLQGLGEIDDSGVRSRGLTFATRRGRPVVIPATGIIRFAGPFRAYDGIVIIDHGGGWMSLILNVATSLPAGTRVRGGDPLGRALGRLGVELSHNGQHLSPALIAGSSATLSNTAKDG